MNFEDKIKKAISRGQQRATSRADSERKKAMTAEEIRRRHNEYRLSLSEYIEHALRPLQTHFPGFDYETIYGSRGWGGAISREDLGRGPSGKSGAFFSRLEVTVRPQNEFNVVNIAGKGTIKNKEMLSWNHFTDIEDYREQEFQQKIDSWILEYAEQFAAH